MTWEMWLASWVPIVVGHFSAKHLSKVAGVDSLQFYGETMALIVIIQYVYFFIGSTHPFK